MATISLFGGPADSGSPVALRPSLAERFAFSIAKNHIYRYGSASQRLSTIPTGSQLVRNHQLAMVHDRDSGLAARYAGGTTAQNLRWNAPFSWEYASTHASHVDIHRSCPVTISLQCLNNATQNCTVPCQMQIALSRMVDCRGAWTTGHDNEARSASEPGATPSPSTK